MFQPLATVLGLVMALSGSSKIQSKPVAVAAAQKLNYTNIMKPIGIAELILGIVSVLGYWDFVPDMLVVGAILGIAVIMAGAILFHLKAKDVKGAVVPLVLFLMAVAALTVSNG
jgi:hypothetical protein